MDSGQAWKQKSQYYTTVVGTTPEYQITANFPVEKGTSGWRNPDE